MSQTLSVSDVTIGQYTLSVTTRDSGDTTDMLAELTYRTIKAWLWIVNKLEKGEYQLPLTEDGDVLGSVEDRLSAEFIDHDETMFPNETGEDSRVTVWDTFKSQSRIGFHLNSSDLPQIAIDVWLANHKGIERVVSEYQQNAPQSNVAPQNSSAAPQDRPATPKNQNPPQNGNVPILTKKEAIAKLNAGDPFKCRFVQIEKHSKDGKDFYDFFEPMGGKAGQYSSATVYTDNEVAINNGFIAALEALGIKAGFAQTGNWLMNCTLGKPKTKMFKGEEKTFVNIYVNSFDN